MKEIEYRLQSTEYRLQITEYRVQITDYRLQMAEYRVRMTEEVGGGACFGVSSVKFQVSIHFVPLR